MHRPTATAGKSFFLRRLGLLVVNIEIRCYNVDFVASLRQPSHEFARRERAGRIRPSEKLLVVVDDHGGKLVFNANDHSFSSAQLWENNPV